MILYYKDLAEIVKFIETNFPDKLEEIAVERNGLGNLIVSNSERNLGWIDVRSGSFEYNEF